MLLAKFKSALFDFRKGHLAYNMTTSGFYPQPSLRLALRKGRSEKAMDKILTTE